MLGLPPLEYISSITFNTRISPKLLNKVNEMIWRLCLENGYHYIETRNIIRMNYLRMVYICKVLAFSKLRLHLQSSKFHCKVTNVRHFFRKTKMVPQYRLARDSGVASATRQ